MREFVVLIVEGWRADSHSVVPALEKVSCTQHVFHTGKGALAAVKSINPDLIIFNASTMRSSGTRSCRSLRRATVDVPIIHIRAEKEPEQASAEADVYLERPFTARKLLNRVKVLLPVDYSREEVIRCGGITFYRTKRSVDVVDKGESRLTPKLARLLEEFVRHPNEIVSRRQLMQNVWKTDYIGDTRTLDVHIRWIREAIEQDPANPQLLHTVRGEGYRFVCKLPSK